MPSPPGLNPVTLEVVRHAIYAIAEEMSLIIMRSARSPLLKEDGRLYIGHSERVGYGVTGLASDGLTIYRRTGGRRT